MIQGVAGFGNLRARSEFPGDRMADLRAMQLRLVYSLLKPAVRAAARFGVPIRILDDLLRLAYFEHLERAGLSLKEIADRFGQSVRHMYSLQQQTRGDFLAAERDPGLGRAIEALGGPASPTA